MQLSVSRVLECFLHSRAMMKPGWLFGLFIAGSLGAAFSCSSNDGSASDEGAPAARNGDIGGPTQNPGSGQGVPSIFAGADASVALPPEKEVDVGFELPHAGAHFVYVANPDSNSIAVIDAKTLAIQTVEAGTEPRFLQTFGDADAAIVLNVASSDASIVRTDLSGTSTVVRVPVQRGSNAIGVAPDGKHAIVYFNAAFSTTGGLQGSLQDVNVVKLADGADTSTSMTIGYRASRVFFSNDGAKGFVVTEDGVSVLDFDAVDKTGPGIATLVKLGDQAIGKTPDVSVTPDGRYALAREQTGSALRLVDLVKGTIQRLDLATIGTEAEPTSDAGAAKLADGGREPPDGAPTTPPISGPATVTDVDLSPGGDFAVAVLRERSGVVRVPIPDAFNDASRATLTTVPGELIGSVTLTPNGKYALLYTTVDPTNEHLTILPLKGNPIPETVQLRKSVSAVAVSADENSALIVHQKLPGDPNEPGIDDETKADRQDGYSVVSIPHAFAKLQLTAAPLGPSTIVPDSSTLFILFNAKGLREVQRVDLKSLEVFPTELGSPPISVGAVPTTNRVFVGQDHPDGRISFIDWTTGAVQSVTGFALNSRIRE